MKVNLDDRIIRTVVQEYTDAIVNYKSKEELDFDVHKLIHTFQVLEVAQKLIQLTRPALPKKVQKQILNSAVLHDIGRCHEFMDGYPRKNFNHGQAGYLFAKKHFPSLVVEGGCIKWHNKRPSDKDPADLSPVLDYTRDADILGNLQYNTANMSIFVQHIIGVWKHSPTPLKISDEIKRAVAERRSCIYSQMEKFDFLDMLVGQLLWIYNLRTQAGYRYIHRSRIFSRYRDVIVKQALPLIPGTADQRKETGKMIMSLFSNALFEKEIKRHGL